ncbi:MAG: RIP metalloprotease, partial [Deltaproteobacteria bacterium]
RWGPGEVILLPTGVALLVFLGLLPLFVALHELGHGIACKACGRRVDAVGLTMIDHLVPGVYVDVTDIYMASRGQRIAVALAGPLVNLLVAGGLALVAAALPTTRASSLLWIAADANLALALYTLWPFWGIVEDGYDALGEALRQPRLRSLAWAWLRARLRRRAPPDSIAPWRAVMYLVGVGGTWLGVGLAFVRWLWG